MYKARDELYKGGFIVINCYGGKSAKGRKLPNLYALTWAGIDELKNIKEFDFRITHYSIGKVPLKYFLKGNNPDFKDKGNRKKQYYKDIKKVRP